MYNIIRQLTKKQDQRFQDFFILNFKYIFLKRTIAFVYMVYV